MSAANTWGIENENSKGGSPALLSGGEYRFRWPDGTEETLTVEMQPFRESVSDHGHSYPVEGEEPYLVEKRHGAEVRTPLRTLCGTGLQIERL
jgi:hypothetical protein